MGPLAGLKVIEIAAMGPVPFCGMMLADLGAEVIRVDRVAAADMGIERPSEYELRGRNKRSVAIDLKSENGRKAFFRLVESADVVLEGFRPGVSDRMGIGADACLAVRPSLVFGKATGWGQDGPLAQTAGHDINYIALTGALDMIGPAGGAPVPPLNLLGDYGGGAMFLALGVLAAVFEARRTGQGQVVDTAMVDGVNMLLAVFHGFNAAGQLNLQRGGNILDGGAPYYTTYQTSDGRYMAVGAIEARFYAEMLKRMELDPTTLPKQNDRAEWPRLQAALARRFLDHTQAEWAEIFEGSDACVSPVLTLAEAARHPHNVARGILTDVAGIPHPTPAPRFSRSRCTITRPPAREGEHSVEVLRDWGLSQAEIDAGLSEGYIAARTTPA
ncbi:MAG: CoA transferase [Paracoccus sp. BP8]|uniref:CaiB/BaiF CoA transferase family protein n=1 Tax=Paracoccus sp. J39 TaxID=935848 RepID=UPI0004B66D7D|nr:CaiB/BaiF CoA-transferase family protein [Paracoccus sp. J39]RQP03865.1 MAG: CoA transferase [Paracoccus sp. BP8]